MEKSRPLILSTILGVFYSFYIILGSLVITRGLVESSTIATIVFLVFVIPCIIALLTASIFSVMAVFTQNQYHALVAMIFYFASGVPLCSMLSYSICSGIIGCLSLWAYFDLRKKSNIDINEKEDIIEEEIIIKEI